MRGLSEKEEIVLGLLLQGKEMYGLAMVEASRGGLKRGTIYVTLGRMESKGYISSRATPRTEGPGIPRRFYQITDAGRRMYEAWQQAKALLSHATL